MAFGIGKPDTDDALKIIKATQANLLQAKEAVDENLYYQKEGLSELSKFPHDHQESIEAYQNDIKKIEQSVSKVEARIKRIETIIEQKDTSFFLISAATTQHEIKELMNMISNELAITNDSAKKQFLETVQETAESCKEYISQKQPFESQYIPLLDSEKKYTNSLVTVAITNKKLDALINTSPDQSSDFKIIKEMYNQAANRKKYLGFIGKESAFLKELQNNIETIINNQPIPDGVQLLQKIHPQIAEHIKSLDSTGSYSYEFKKIINQLCAKFNELNTKIQLPILFNVTGIKENLAWKFKQIKTDFQDMKAASIHDSKNIKQPTDDNDRHELKGP